MSPLRSFLFTPGDSGRKLQKAAKSTADVVVIDLEDAVAPSVLSDAHAQTLEALRSIDFGTTLRMVRINADSLKGAQADIKAIVAGQPDGIVVPKVETKQLLDQLADDLPEGMPVYAMIETALGFMNLGEIIQSSANLRGLILGGEDLIASIGARAMPNREELTYARGALVMAAAAAGLQAIDTVYTAWRDVDGLATQARTMSDMGFSGKLAIHPVQIEPIHQAFAPTADEVEWARDVLHESRRLKEQGIGVFSYGGKMIDEAHIRLAESILNIVDSVDSNGGGDDA